MNQRFLCFISISFLILTAFTHESKACSCGTSVNGNVGLGGPIITMPAYTLARNKFALSTGIQYLDVDQFSRFKFKQVNRRKEHTHSYDSATSLFLSAIYGVTDDFNIMLTLPYNSISNLITTFEGQNIDEGDSTGLGDLTILGKYRFLKLNGPRIQAAVLAGITIPTGHTEEKNEFGFKLGADDQPGTGSWDPLIGLALSKQYNKFSLDTNVLYQLSTEGSQDTIVGDTINFNFATSYLVQEDEEEMTKLDRLFPKEVLGLDLDWSLVLEMNGQWHEKVEFRGEKDDSHGGTTIFISPGIRVAIEKNWIANLAISLPLIESLNGTQPDSNYQLFFSISKLF